MTEHSEQSKLTALRVAMARLRNEATILLPPYFLYVRVAPLKCVSTCLYVSKFLLVLKMK